MGCFNKLQIIKYAYRLNFSVVLSIYSAPQFTTVQLFARILNSSALFRSCSRGAHSQRTVLWSWNKVQREMHTSVKHILCEFVFF